jgi:ASPIC and UnbV.
LTDAYVIGEGLGSDQTSTVTFGLGSETEVTSIKIALSNGTTENINNPKVNAVNTL